MKTTRLKTMLGAAGTMMTKFACGAIAFTAFGAFAAGPKVEVGIALANTEPCFYTNAAGKTFNYRWHTPTKAEEWKKYPLFILMHGAGERGDDNAKQLCWAADQLFTFMKHKGEGSYKNFGCEFYFFAGQVPLKQQWVDTPWSALSHTMAPEPSESMGLQFEVLEKLFKENPTIDRRRVYVMGMSMGGYGTWDFVCRKPEWVAAAMPMCGGADLAQAAKIKDIPIWVFHGSADDCVSVKRSRNMVAALWTCEAKDIRYREFPGCGHDCWSLATGTYGDFSAFEWMFEQRKPTGNTGKKRHPETKDWQPLFANDLSDAVFDAGTWTVKDLGATKNVLTPTDVKPIFTKAEWKDFELDFEYSLNCGGNSGCFLYVSKYPEQKIELQLMDDADPVVNDIPHALSGSLYGGVVATTAPLTKKAAWCWWNRVTVRCEGKKVSVLLNGYETANVNLDDFQGGTVNPDGYLVPPWMRNYPAWCKLPTQGKIGFQGKHGTAEVFYRNIRIRKTK